MKRTTTIMGMVLFLTLLISVPVRAQIQLENPVVTDADVTLSLTDKNGTELDQTKLYFSVYKDNADAPVLFDKTTFAYIDSEMTEIPYGYSDSQMYDIWSSDGTTTIYHPSSWSGFKKLGAQAIYHDGDVTYTSEIVWNDGSIGYGEDGGDNGDNTGDKEDSEFDDSDLISNPAGEKFETVRTSTVYYKLGGTTVYSGDDTGARLNYVKGDDGNLYLLCVTGGNSTENYLKLEPLGENRYSAKMPQLVMIEEYDGVKYGYYASRMEKETIADNPDSISFLLSSTVPNELSFTLHENGSLSMDAEDGNVILGLTYSDGLWTGYGDAMIADTLVAQKKNALPENAEPCKWVMEYQWANWSEYGTMRMYLDVAVTDGEIFINNPYNMAPDQWIKGAIEGDKAVFETCQLLGEDDETNRYLYFRVGNLTKDINGYYSYADADKLVFNYDAEAQTLTTDDLVSMYISRGYGQRGYNVNYDFPQFSLYTETVSAQQDPSFELFAPDDTYDSYGYSYIQVRIPSTDVDGNELNTENLYYSIYVDDSTTPFVFEASTYKQDFTTDVTEIPYTHEGYDIYSYATGSDLRNIFFYFSTANVRFGVQSIYYASDGTVYKSNIVYGSSTSGIEEVSVNEEDDNAPIFNLQGQMVDPESLNKGSIYIKKGKKFIHR